MRFPRFEPGTHGFKIHQDIHYAMEADAKYRKKINICQSYNSQFSYLPYICYIVTKVSVLFNLRISRCELRDNYCVSFTQLFKKNSDFKSHCGFSIAGAGYTIFPVWEEYFVSLIISTSNGSVFWVFYDY